MLTDRLDMIVSHISGKTVADVGTDHAYVAVKLVSTGRCDRVIATDIRRGPLEAARRNVKKNNCSDRVELRLGAGLSPLAAGECDEIVIAGMGGELICSILRDGAEVAAAAKRLLLQPMNSQAMLREFLTDNGYAIVCEDIECEGFKVYNLIIARKGGEVPKFADGFETELPPYLYGHRNFGALLRKKRREFTKILTGLESAAEKDWDRIEKYRGYLARCDEVEYDSSGDCTDN